MNFHERADSDFKKARKRATLSLILNSLTPERQELLSLQDVKELLKPKASIYRGMQTVPLDKIVGSEGRYRDFTRAFLPKGEFLRSRWENIDRAHLKDIILPPVKLYRIGGLYFVRDGNHRVSVARLQKSAAMDAEVIQLDTELPLRPDMDIKRLKAEVIRYEKEDIFVNTELGKIISPRDLEFSETGRFHEILRHIQGHKYYQNLDRPEEISFLEAGFSWYAGLYRPIIGLIKEYRLLRRFPGRTASDLYIWIIKHWDSLKRQHGGDFSLEKAAIDFSHRHGQGFFSRFRFRK